MIGISSFASNNDQNLVCTKPFGEEYKKPLVVHISGSFSVGALTWVYNFDVTYDACLTCQPPTVTVISVHGNVCLGGTGICGVYKTTDITTLDGDTKSWIMDIESGDVNDDVLSYINDPKFVNEIKGKIINGK
jgi:hypothetical protein